MTTFSSHRGLQDSKMRVLILFTAILAYGNGAPSHLVHLAPLAVQTIGYRAAIPAFSSGDIQAAAIDGQVKYVDLAQSAVDKSREIADQTIENLNIKAYTNIAAEQEKLNEALWVTEDKKWQTLDAIQTAQAQLDGALASNAPVLAKSAAVGSYVAGIGPYSAVASYSALPAISSGDIQAAAIDAHVKYADLAQAAVDNARQISEQAAESAQAQLDGALASNTAALAKSAIAGSYVNAVAPYSGVAPVGPAFYPGIVAPATKSISNQFLVQSHPATFNADANANAAEASIKAAEASMKAADLSVKSAESQKSDIEKSMKIAEASMVSGESQKSNIEKSMVMAEGSISSAESEKSNIEKSMMLAEGSMSSAESEKSNIDKSIIVAGASTSSAESEKSNIEKSINTAGISMSSFESAKIEIEKSVKSAEAALEAAKSEADKAFAALQLPLVPQTVGLTNAYLIPGVYSTIGLRQPIVDPLQPIAPVLGQAYLKPLC